MPFTPNPYFSSDPRRWTPELFGAACLGKNPDYSSQRILDAYVKSLNHISLDKKATERKRSKADHLLEKYREVCNYSPVLQILFHLWRDSVPDHSRLFAEPQNQCHGDCTSSWLALAWSLVPCTGPIGAQRYFCC